MGGGAGGPQTWEIGHKRGQWGQMHGDVQPFCMSCDARMHIVAYGTIESGVTRLGEELGRLTVDTQCFERKLCTITATVP